MSTTSLFDVVTATMIEEKASLRIVAAAADLIAADAAFNLWFGRVVKADEGRSDESVLAILEEYERLCEACINACTSARKASSADREMSLLPVLRQATRNLRGFIGDVSIDEIR
jgi:hypothetical protein